MKQLGLGLVALALIGLALGHVQAESKQLKAEKEFRGSIEDATLAKQAPAGGVIASKAAMEKLWKAWGIKDEMPALDFTKELAAVSTSRGSRIVAQATLDDKGDLRVGGFGTKDLRPGFRYHIIIIKSDGVKTVNGKELPKE